MDKKAEIGWLIEDKDGSCLGWEEKGKIVRNFWCWTTPDFAVRFARKIDAERVIAIISTHGEAVEHVWS